MMDGKVRRDLRRAKSVISTVQDWQRFGVEFALDTACDSPEAARAALYAAGRYPNGTTPYEVHRKIMAWFDAALTPSPASK
jgi:hypothetical protein